MINKTNNPDGEILSEADKRSKKFLVNWLFNRLPALKDNLKSYDEAHSPDANIYSDERIKAEYGRQVGNMDKSGLYPTQIIPDNTHGQFDNNDNYVVINKNIIKEGDPVLDDIVVHERTHSLKPLPQEVAISDLIKKRGGVQINWYDDKTNNYLNKPGEIYARLMSFRHKNGLSPDQIVTQDDIKRWRKGKELKAFDLDGYQMDFLLNLFNKIASNEQKPDESTGFKA